MTSNQPPDTSESTVVSWNSSLFADRSAEVRRLDAAIESEPDDGVRGSLLLDRAIVQQGDSDPAVPASDSVRAFDLLLASGRSDEAALAAAVSGAMMHRTGDIEAAVDHAVEAMALVDIADKTMVAARAANAIAVLFSQLSAFEQAVTYANLAEDICEVVGISTPVAIRHNACYIAIEAHHVHVALPLDRARQAVVQLCQDPNPIARDLVGAGMAAELSFLDAPDRIGRVDLDDAIIDEASQRLQAWYRLVLATIAHGAGDHERAIDLLDIALPSLFSAGENHRVVRAYRLRSNARAALGDMAGALADSNAVADIVRGWQVDQVGRLAVQISRRVELEQLQSSMQRRATDLVEQINVDELTRTGSRRFLEVRLDEIERRSGSVSIVLVDIDEFKKVNDAHGHVVGDAVLTEVGKALSTTSQACEVLARYGGDEFVAIFTESGNTLARRFAEDVTDTLSRTNWHDISPFLDVHVSSGVAAGRCADARDVIKKADAALYSAKRRGRNQYVVA